MLLTSSSHLSAPGPQPQTVQHTHVAAALLHTVQVRPGCWQLVNPSKAILPRLWALLRHGCYGSAAGSFPALLPLLALVPATVVGPSPHVLEQLLGSCWTGLKTCSAR